MSLRKSLIGSSTHILFENVLSKRMSVIRTNERLLIYIHYTFVFLLIFILVWATQFVPSAPPSHLDAYRNVFLNFTGIYTIFIMYELVKNRIYKKQY